MAAIVVARLSAVPGGAHQGCDQYGRPDFAILIDKAVMTRLWLLLRHFLVPFPMPAHYFVMDWDGMKAVGSRFQGIPVNAREGLRRLRKCNRGGWCACGNFPKIPEAPENRLTADGAAGISAAMKTPTAIICTGSIITG